jgi:hypothetical protein
VKTRRRRARESPSRLGTANIEESTEIHVQKLSIRKNKPRPKPRKLPGRSRREKDMHVYCFWNRRENTRGEETREKTASS